MRLTRAQAGPRNRPPSIRQNQKPIPLRALTRKYDRQNDIAAAVILDNPEKHSRFQVDWARRYTARRASERREPPRNSCPPPALPEGEPARVVWKKARRGLGGMGQPQV